MGRCCSGTRASSTATSRPCAPPGSHYGFDFDPSVPVRALDPVQRDLLLYGVDSPIFRSHYPDIDAPDTVAKGRFEGVVTNLLRRHAEHTTDPDTDYLREAGAPAGAAAPAPSAAGRACAPRPAAVSVAGRSIVEVTRMPLGELAAWIAGLQHGPARRGLADRRADRRRSAGTHPAAGRDRPGLPDPRARHPVALGGRGAAAAAGGPARLRADRRALRPG